jgi:DNA-directed RNA polymerase subunit RPC12/RpoP
MRRLEDRRRARTFRLQGRRKPVDIGGMEAEPVRCPGCGGAMSIAVNPAVSSREYVCNDCGSAVAGVAVFRQLLGEHQVGLIWNGGQSEGSDGAQPPRCGFCFASMESRTLETGHAAICKTCQVIWLDKDALGSLTAAVPVQHLSDIAVPKCSNCGAAISSPLDEKCKYCGAALELAPPVVVAPAPAGAPTDWTGNFASDFGGAGHAAYWFTRAVGALLDPPWS